MKRRLRAGLASGCIAVLASYASLAFAQSETKKEGSLLEEVIVTAERRAENSQKVPISMSVFSRDFIADYIRDATDLADFTPNLHFTEGNGWRQAVGTAMRGLGLEERPTSVSSNSILTYYDGIPVGTTFASGIPQFDLERIEVQRGPQGTLYGRNALAGAMQYFSAAPTRELSGFANVSIGEENMRQFEGGISGPITERIRARLSGSVFERDGEVTSTTTNALLGEREWMGVRAIVDFDVTDKFNGRLKAQYFDGEQDNVFFNVAHGSTFAPVLQSQFAAEGTDPDLHWKSDFKLVQSPLPDPWEKLDLTLVEADLNYDFGPVALTSVTGYMQGESTAFFDFRNRKPAVQIIAVGALDPSSTEQWSQEVRLTSQTDDGLQWIVGAYYQESKDVLGTSAVSIGPLVPASIIPMGSTLGSFSSMGSFDDLTTYAIFAHTTYHWTDRLKTTHAVRYTEEERSTEFGLSASIFYPTSPGAAIGSVQAEGYDLLEYAKLPYTQLRAQAVGILSDPNTRDANGNLVPRFFSDSWDQLTYRLGADYQLSDQALLYGSISTGFKAGAFAAIAAGGARAPIDPEVSLVYEIGTKTQWLDDRLQVNASVFYNDHKDLQANQFVSEIDPITGVLTGFFRVENLPKTKIYGGELEIRALPLPDLIVALNLGFLDSEIVEALPGNNTIVGKELPYVADTSFSSVIRYNLHTHVGTFSPQITGRYRGEYWSSKDNDDITGPLGDYWMAEFRLGYLSPSSRIDASFYLRNLFDTMQSTWNSTALPHTSTGTTSSRVTEGRNWGIKVGYRF